MSSEKFVKAAWRFTEKFVCDCSALVTDYNFNKHIKTRKHLKFLSNPSTPVRSRYEIIKKPTASKKRKPTAVKNRKPREYKKKIYNKNCFCNGKFYTFNHKCAS